MNTPQSYAPIVGLGIALLITLPCAADEQDAAQNKLYPNAKPMAVDRLARLARLNRRLCQKVLAKLIPPQKNRMCPTRPPPLT